MQIPPTIFVYPTNSLASHITSYHMPPSGRVSKISQLLMACLILTQQEVSLDTCKYLISPLTHYRHFYHILISTGTDLYKYKWTTLSYQSNAIRGVHFWIHFRKNDNILLCSNTYVVHCKLVHCTRTWSSARWLLSARYIIILSCPKDLILISSIWFHLYMPTMPPYLHSIGCFNVVICCGFFWLFFFSISLNH